MNPEDLFEKGLIRASDLDGGPPAGEAAELGPFGRYMLLEELGRGGAGVVFRAHDPLLNRELALKRLRFGDFELEARFLREAELLARLSHAGIMPIFDFGREAESLYYTMPLAAGLSLDRWIVERRPDALASARIVREAAEALAHAHDKGVLHRDVKPPNILVSAEGHALVADFGLGRVVDPKGRDAGRMTASGEVMGTPSYMAPEFALGDLKGVDARCDVYGLGATLYEALTGRPPFIGRSSLEILKRVTSEEPVAPRRIAPGTPADLEIICLKGLEKDPSRRYSTAREMADDLGRFLAGEPIRARRASPFYRLRRFVGRRRAIVAVSTVAVLVVTAVLLVGVWGNYSDSARSLRIAGYLASAEQHRSALDGLLRTFRDTDAAVESQARMAHEWISKALGEEPDHPEAHYWKGRIHALRLEKTEARQSYSMAIEKGPFPHAHLERAILDCQDLVQLSLDSAPRRNTPKLSALKLSIHQDLESSLRLKLDPAGTEFAEALLECSRLTPEGFEAAVKRFDNHVARHPDWRAFYWKGIAETESNQLEKGRKSLQRALEFRQNCRAGAIILNRLGMVLSDLGYSKSDLELQREARDRLRQASEIDREWGDPPLHLVSILLFLEEEDEALRWSEEALRRNKKSSKALALRGLACVQKHRKDPGGGSGLLLPAKECLQAALPAFPPASEQARAVQSALDYVLAQLKN